MNKAAQHPLVASGVRRRPSAGTEEL